MTLTKKGKKTYRLLAAYLRQRKYRLILLTGILFSWSAISIGFFTSVLARENGKVLGESISLATQAVVSPVIEITLAPPTETPIPTLTATPTPKPTNTPTSTPNPPAATINPSKYTAEKIGDTTWRVTNVKNDSSMASANDVVNALNSYRSEHGRGQLTVDLNLSTFAQERSSHFNSRGDLDSHAGFRDYMNNGGFEKSGFNSLGENSAKLSGPMSGERIVKEIFGADSEHDGNQLDNWTHVGVGINGNFINVNFGKNKR